MSTRRLAVTALAMVAVGGILAALGPDLATLTGSFLRPQRVADLAGPVVVVTAWAAALAWLVWAWGLLGLVLTAATALPGILGGTARAALSALLPAAARRAAAVAVGLGVGVGLGAPFASAAPLPAPATDSVATVPDWPSDEPAPSPAPDRASPADHVVVRGDCLWDIAADRLATEVGHRPTDAEIARSVPAWWRSNADVIGADPDLLLPGQVLRPPGA
jgi:nucleoid-associated protein YgaU